MGLGSSMGMVGNTINEFQSDLADDIESYTEKYVPRFYNATDFDMYQQAQPSYNQYEHQEYYNSKDAVQDRTSLLQDKKSDVIQGTQEPVINMYCTTDPELLESIILQFIEAHRKHKDTADTTEAA
ncbi:hypothetical protein NHE_0201 [Neorickettsia helminthoeca str. Oregon]|uniref:Uncharacterized protein n=2 Tax=Neorickettsia helminthoeca TaxID=33994 RepID=X5H3M9_9RICK|nr:hypothetical protein NHE_0201 [Neorickettsia helminthoeca str. Oregon]